MANNKPKTLFSNFSLILEKSMKSVQQRQCQYKMKPALPLEHASGVRYDIRPIGSNEHHPSSLAEAALILYRIVSVSFSASS